MAHRQPSDYRFESEIQADILAQFGSKHPMKIWRNNVGTAYPIGPVKDLVKRITAAIYSPNKLKDLLLIFKKMRPVEYSVPGSADILGILKGGRFLAIEVKMPGKGLEEDQVTWRDAYVPMGALHIVATCIEDVYVGLEKEGIKCR